MKKILRKILRWVYPELGLLNSQEYDFTHLRSWKNNVEEGMDVQICPVHLLDNVKIGNHSYIGHNSVVSNTTIGNFCSIGPNFFCGWGIHPTNGLSTSPHIYSTRPKWTVAKQDLIKEHGDIKIGNDVFIGANVVVLENVSIGDGAVIGAGAVVSEDIPDYAIAVGVPAKVIKYRMTPPQIEKMKKIQWWNWDVSDIMNVNNYFFEIDAFIAKYSK